MSSKVLWALFAWQQVSRPWRWVLFLLCLKFENVVSESEGQSSVRITIQNFKPYTAKYIYIYIIWQYMCCWIKLRYCFYLVLFFILRVYHRSGPLFSLGICFSMYLIPNNSAKGIYWEECYYYTCSIFNISAKTVNPI